MLASALPDGPAVVVLTAYDQPFFGRADSLTLGPLNPAETADALGLAAADAIDAHLVSGGLPGVLRNWPDGTPALAVRREEAADPASPLFSIPEAVLLAESRPRTRQHRRSSGRHEPAFLPVHRPLRPGAGSARPP